MKRFSDLNWFVLLLGMGGLLFLIVGQKGNLNAQLFGGGVFVLTLFYFLRFERALIRDLLTSLFGCLHPRQIRTGIKKLHLALKGERRFYTITVVAVALLSLSFGVYHLGMFMSVDEPKWLNTRVPQLYSALFSGEWESTYINDQPGVLPSLLSGITNLFLDKSSYTPETIEHYFFWWRFPILFFSFLSFFLIYHFARLLINRQVALATIVLIALHPVIIGISQIVNPDATLWNTGFLAFLTFFLYLKTSREKYILYTGFFLGLALISKYFISIFYVVFFLTVYLEYLLRKTDRVVFLRRTWDLIKIYVLSVATYTLLFPINWVELEQIIRGTVGANILTAGRTMMLIFVTTVLFEIIFLRGVASEFIRKNIDIGAWGTRTLSMLFIFAGSFLVINLFADYKFFDPEYFKFFVYDRGSGAFLQTLIASGYIMLFTFTLPALIGFVSFLMLSLTKYYKIIEDRGLLFITVLVTIAIFVVGAALGGFAISARYQIILYPLYALLAGLLFVHFIPYYKLFVTALALYSATVVFISAPFYLQYTNALNIHDTTAMSTWGYGGYELAQHVAQKIGKDKIIWSDREGFKEFYPSPISYWRGIYNPFNAELGVEYLVLSNDGEHIFYRALKQQEQGKNSFYGREAVNTPIFQYYKKERLYEICLYNNPNHCTWIVKMDRNDAIF